MVYLVYETESGTSGKGETGETVYLVYLVCLVCLVRPVGFVDGTNTNSGTGEVRMAIAIIVWRADFRRKCLRRSIPSECRSLHRSGANYGAVRQWH